MQKFWTKAWWRRHERIGSITKEKHLESNIGGLSTGAHICLGCNLKELLWAQGIEPNPGPENAVKIITANMHALAPRIYAVSEWNAELLLLQEVKVPFQKLAYSANYLCVL